MYRFPKGGSSLGSHLGLPSEGAPGSSPSVTDLVTAFEGASGRSPQSRPLIPSALEGNALKRTSSTSSDSSFCTEGSDISGWDTFDWDAAERLAHDKLVARAAARSEELTARVHAPTPYTHDVAGPSSGPAQGQSLPSLEPIVAEPNVFLPSFRDPTQPSFAEPSLSASLGQLVEVSTTGYDAVAASVAAEAAYRLGEAAALNASHTWATTVILGARNHALQHALEKGSSRTTGSTGSVPLLEASDAPIVITTGMLDLARSSPWPIRRLALREPTGLASELAQLAEEDRAFAEALQSAGAPEALLPRSQAVAQYGERLIAPQPPAVHAAGGSTASQIAGPSAQPLALGDVVVQVAPAAPVEVLAQVDVLDLVNMSEALLNLFS
jgi:hypothetical protein